MHLYLVVKYPIFMYEYYFLANVPTLSEIINLLSMFERNLFAFIHYSKRKLETMFYVNLTVHFDMVKLCHQSWFDVNWKFSRSRTCLLSNLHVGIILNIYKVMSLFYPIKTK